MSNQQNDELLERTFVALLNAAPHISLDELSVLCYHAGIPSKEVIAALEQDKEYA